jgi:transcriptional regulator with XRE-family HTH domain
MDVPAPPLHKPQPAHVGVLLREWRAARRLSQLDLALVAEVSTRHLSCVETGKAQPSREMLMRLADALDMPLRERNALLVAAGYAARFVMRERASVHDNLIRQIFDPADLRPAVANWEEVAGDLIRHLHAAVAAAPSDEAARALLDEALAYPGVPSRWRLRELDAVPLPLLTTVLRRDEHELRFFSTITTFATSRDVTLDELHIECCFPVDEATATLCRALAEQATDAALKAM